MALEPGIYEAKRNTQWDPYPQAEPVFLVCVEADGAFNKFSYFSGPYAGVKCCAAPIIIRKCPGLALLATGV